LAVLASASPAQAASLTEYWKDLEDWFIQGGSTMPFILACSILAMAFAIERIIRLRRKRIVPKNLARVARALWRDGQFEELADRCERDGSILARAIGLMVRHRAVPMADVRTMAGDSVSADMGVHWRRVRPLAVAATIAPLLGLFGTVVGIIDAFKKFNLLGETGNPAVFADSISLALITTEFGLAVAIPALAVWHLFRIRTNTFTDELEGNLRELLVEWFIEGQQPAAAGAVPVAVR
jgi:biopolymer transport protein ExbB